MFGRAGIAQQPQVLAMQVRHDVGVIGGNVGLLPGVGGEIVELNRFAGGAVDQAPSFGGDRCRLIFIDAAIDAVTTPTSSPGLTSGGEATVKSRPP